MDRISSTWLGRTARLFAIAAVYFTAAAVGVALTVEPDRVLLVRLVCAFVCLSTFLLTVSISERQQREREILALNETLKRGLTERHNAIAELHNQKRMLESILDSMGDAVLVTDRDGNIILKNKAFRQIHDADAPSEKKDWPQAFGVYLADGKSLCPSDELPIFRALRGESCDNVELMVVNPAYPSGLAISVTARPIMASSEVNGAVIAIRDVSEVRRSAVALRNSELRYRLLVNGVRDYAIFMLDPTGHVASWNVGAERLKGYTEAEIIGSHFSCFYLPEDVASGKLPRELREATDLGRFEEEGWRVRKDGTQFWAHVVISVVRDAEGAIQGFAKATRDLTAKREAEHALKRSEQRFRAIFDQTLQFIGLMSADGTVLEANRTAIRAVGVREEEVLGKKFWETVWWTHDSAQQARLREAVARAAAGETVRFEAHHPAPDGSKIWVDFSLKPYLADGGVLYLIPEGREISDRKRAELALVAKEALLQQFVRYSPAAIAMLDTSMRYIRASDQWAIDYRLDGRDIIGRSHYEVFPDIPERWRPIHQRALAGAVESCLEDSFPRADGSVEWLQWAVRPWHEPDGQIGGIIFFTQVITARVEAAQRAALRLTAARILSEATATVAEVAAELLRVVCESRRWDVGEFWKQTADGKSVALTGNWCSSALAGFGELSRGLKFEHGAGLPGRVWDSNAPQIIPDLAADAGFLRRTAAAEYGIASGIAFPVVVGGRVVGVFLFLSRQVYAPAADDMALLEELAGKFGLWLEQKRAEAALIESEARFRLVFNASPSSLILVNADGEIALANELTVTMFGWSKPELIGRPIELIVPDPYLRAHRTARQTYFTSPQSQAVGAPSILHGRRKDGQMFPIEIGLTPLVVGGQAFVLASVVDISVRKRTEEALRISEERLRLALENAKHGLWDWEVQSGAVYADATWHQIHGYADGEVKIDRDWWQATIHPDDVKKVITCLSGSLASDDLLYDVEYRGRRKDGSWTWLNTRGRVQNRDAAGNATRMMGTLQDISTRKRAEQDLLRSVREKEAMLREIHHRVKNNLAVISSLFHLQAGSVHDPALAAVLREGQDRVRSMALVHEHLYNSADLAAVAFADYAKTLATQIIETYQLPSTPIELLFESEGVRLTIEQAIPCGLILNELLANCLKHAFKGRSRGLVSLSIAAVATACVIRVTDNGIGVSKDLDMRLGKSLGVRLIRILSRQLRGSIEYRSLDQGGTEVCLEFPIQADRDN